MMQLLKEGVHVVIAAEKNALSFRGEEGGNQANFRFLMNLAFKIKFAWLI